MTTEQAERSRLIERIKFEGDRMTGHLDTMHLGRIDRMSCCQLEGLLTLLTSAPSGSNKRNLVVDFAAQNEILSQ
jgi:hypothetical protein